MSDTHQVWARWRQASWELLPETPRPPALNVALDQVLMPQVGAGQRPPTLRFWGWTAPALVLGRFQSVRNEVDEPAAQALGITLVRRLTGGGTMFIEPAGAISFSLYLPQGWVAGLSVMESYEALGGWVVEVLQELGLDVRHAPLNDWVSAEGKVGGSAQARWAGAVLHQATIAYDMNLDLLGRVLRVGREKLSDKGIPSAARRVHPLCRQTDLPRTAILDHLVQGFGVRFGIQPGALTEAELSAAEHLVLERFAHPRWTYELP